MRHITHIPETGSIFGWSRGYIDSYIDYWYDPSWYNFRAALQVNLNNKPIII